MFCVKAGLRYKINLHYDLYADKCEDPSTVKCKYEFDEEEIIMEAIMEYYKKSDKKEWFIKFLCSSLYLQNVIFS